MTLLGPDPLLHPVLLEFATPQLELEFQSRYAKARIRTADLLAVMGTLTFHALFSIFQVGLLQDAHLTAFSATITLHILVTYALASGRLPPCCRTPALVAFRCAADLCIAPAMIAWNEPNVMTSGWPSMLKQLLVNTGVASLCYQPLAYSVPFKVNIFVQPASILVFSYYMTPGCCRILLAHPTTASLTAHIWSGIYEFCSAGRVLGRIEILTASVLTSISKGPTLTCTASISFLQAMLGLFVPLVLLYVAERTERQLFWAGLHGYTPGEVAAAARVHPLTKVGCAYVLLFVGLCFWEAAFVLMHLTPQQWLL